MQPCPKGITQSGQIRYLSDGIGSFQTEVAASTTKSGHENLRNHGPKPGRRQ